MAVSRRGILIGGLVGGGLAVGYMLRPRHYPLPLSPGRNEYAFDAWIKIAADGVVTVAVPQIEMGQAITTLIPQVVACELGADWRQIAVEPAPVSARYANFVLAARWAELWMPLAPGLADDPDSAIVRRWAEDTRFNATADGTSLAAYEAPARAAAAAARAMLMRAAAARWGVAWAECDAQDGFVIHGKRRLPFGALVAEAARYDPPDPPMLRAEAAAEKPGEFPPGAPLRYPRLDLPAKVDGSFLFAGDVRLPGMVYAAIRHGPIGEAELLDYEEADARGVPGLLSLVRHKHWLAATATTWWAAEQALKALSPVFRATGRADTTAIEAGLEQALRDGDATRLHAAGDTGLLAGKLAHQLRYEVAPALHATIETASATARLSGGRLELWIATQAPELARKAAAAAIGLDAADVVLYPMPAGGSFDRRLEHDHAAQVAVIAQRAGRPVQLVWSRWQEHVAGWPRTPAVALMGALPDTEGGIAGWRARLALPASAREFGRRLFGAQSAAQARAASAGEADRLAIAGAVPFYDIAHVAIDHLPAAVPLPTARMRGNAHGYTAFFNESFVDELAHLAGREPLSYRMAMLGQEPRMADCLQRVAALAEWGGGVDNSGQGIACHRIGDARIAMVASARRDETGVRVDRISAVVDLGRIVNLDIARQQVEGGIVFGLGLALGSSTGYEDGLPLVGRLAGLDLPLLADCPRIEVDFIMSKHDPCDPGEIGVAPVAPAVANALFSATGLRFRRLPLLSEDV
ncbi:molybdopterin cofactor-binding domain-containing protein [Novosphingobium album (ex Liu et al. 2023)]|uniref:Molybdopterin-dependent oxidoreductase n=1 Tax=Novosphingobium album (ex Liu et al. 2023) TaxID=3031130 RepID=A0ABT5WLI1_9SPHN|nr:molybdopterin cofactor-binding domain-containing protein [Novosphingobium album (ex Liu et al. 2023)]MDE8650904.1 molybdopterin-dependent oxidoreductase [Novosphingobium album (ex Liu et al. 2023)]